MLPWDPLWRLRHVGYPVSPRGYRGLPAFASLSMAGSVGLEPAGAQGISRGGGAAGVEVRPRKPLEMPMTPDDFKARIRGMLQ